MWWMLGGGSGMLVFRVATRREMSDGRRVIGIVAMKI